MRLMQLARILARRLGDNIADKLGATPEQGELFGLSYQLENIRLRVAEAKTAEDKLAALLAELNRIKNEWFAVKTDNGDKAKLDELVAQYVDTQYKIREHYPDVVHARTAADESAEMLGWTIEQVDSASSITISPEDQQKLDNARRACTEAKAIALRIRQSIASDPYTAQIQTALEQARARVALLKPTPLEQVAAKPRSAKEDRQAFDDELKLLFQTLPVDPSPPVNTAAATASPDASASNAKPSGQ
jgi:hypothetical protein